MKIIRKQHGRRKEEMKELFMTLASKNGLQHSIQWNNFAFSAAAYGTGLQGEIFDDELYIEIKGIFERRVEKHLQDAWNALAGKGLV
ncbi:hypothetical protein CSB45_10170 [candidate division KSB3 bacterium]|uniref:Uncharacterized protein n=1 Tax=candidate division KSB3 bacterium TaxID=2044937 RepID=A0A2G6E411_9BACT|nr:MAG: hypothetical protein CSB45_10170 [candidate division KSB3 bacterium]PIE29320.1 MAG: hypothetical protein CSA57_08925 [candidate division KSB3 bacterium]